MADEKPKVKVYSTSWCVYCRMAKEYFKSKNVAYEEVDVEHDHQQAKDLVMRTGQTGVPVIEIGELTILGFDRPKIDLALNQYKLV